MSAATEFTVGHIYQNRHNHRRITITGVEINDVGLRLFVSKELPAETRPVTTPKRTGAIDWIPDFNREHWIDLTLMNGLRMQGYTTEEE